jgi:hypothetical protein
MNANSNCKDNRRGGGGVYRLNQKSTETETKDKQKSALFPQLYLHKRGPLINRAGKILPPMRGKCWKFAVLNSEENYRELLIYLIKTEQDIHVGLKHNWCSAERAVDLVECNSWDNDCKKYMGSNRSLVTYRASSSFPPSQDVIATTAPLFIMRIIRNAQTVGRYSYHSALKDKNGVTNI